MRGVLFPVLWFGGLGLGTLGTGFLYEAVTRGSGGDLVLGLALFLPGLYIAGTVLARARLAYRAGRTPHPGHDSASARSTP
jgi:hypothetical protein